MINPVLSGTERKMMPYGIRIQQHIALDVGQPIVRKIPAM